MLLEAQFGSNIAPIERPKPQRSETSKSNGTTVKPKPEPKLETDQIEVEDEEEDEDEDADLEVREEAELARLHALGIPVPGIEIKVDKHIARVWLETMEVECAYPVLRDRVKVVVERAVETVADMWSTEPKKPKTTVDAKGASTANGYAAYMADSPGKAAMTEGVNT